MLTRTKVTIVACTSALMLLVLSGIALAAPTNITTEVTPYFSGLAAQAMDLIPLALTVIGIGVAFRLVVGWFHRAG